MATLYGDPRAQGPLRNMNDPMFGVDEAAVARMNQATQNQNNPMMGTLATPGPIRTPSTVPGAPGPSTFVRAAPTPTPYGDFTAPDPTQVANDPFYKFRSAEGEKAIQRSAAARGTLLNGGTLKALESYRQGLASEEAGKAFDRALSVYGTNRDTNAMNFGQQHTSFGDDLAAFQANNAAMPPPAAPGGGAGGSGGAGGDTFAPVDQPLGYGPSLSGDYAASVAASRAANDRANALTSSIRPRAPLNVLNGRVNRGALA